MKCSAKPEGVKDCPKWRHGTPPRQWLETETSHARDATTSGKSHPM